MPDAKRPLTVLSHGLGQDSAMLLAASLEDRRFQRQYLQGELLVMTSATGLEHPETDEYRERVARLCAERDVPYVHLTPDLGYHSPAWQTLHTQWERNHTIQARGFTKTCSIQLKLEPFYRALNALLAQRYGFAARVGRNSRAALYQYAETFGPVQVMIGFAAGEERRVKPTPQGFLRDTVRKVYPLIDLGLNRAGCQSGTRALGHEVPYPSNCQHCPFHSHFDLVRLHAKHPASFLAWERYEHVKLTSPKWAGKKVTTVFCNGKTLRENLEIGLHKYGHLSIEELDHIRHQQGHGNTTAF